MPTSTDWPCHVETSENLASCFRMERETITFPCAKEIVVEECPDSVAVSNGHSWPSGSSLPLTTKSPGKGGVVLHSRPRKLSGIGVLGSSVPGATKSQTAPKTKVAPAVWKRKSTDDTIAPYGCAEEILVQREEECLTTVEQEVCTDYEEEVDDICFKTVPKEKYNCPEFVLMRVCDYIHVYPGAEVPKAPAISLAQSNDPTHLVEEATAPPTKGDPSAGRPNAGRRRLFIQKKTPFSIAGGPFPQKPRMSDWPKPPPGLCYGADCPAHTVPQCYRQPVKFSRQCERGPYQKPYPCKNTVKKRECHVKPVKKRTPCLNVIPTTRRTSCRSGDHRRLSLLRSPISRSLLIPAVEPPAVPISHATEPRIIISTTGYAVDSARPPAKLHEDFHQSTTTGWLPLNTGPQTFSVQTGRPCHFSTKAVVAECTKEVFMPQPYPCLEERRAKECFPGLKTGNEKVRLANDASEFSDSTQDPFPVSAGKLKFLPSWK
ncbi:hypothetical protein TGRUB_262630 [Toxoplasma gondii RUB]|uniref:Uncharacterized protein n=2 Tax=Toxoplasma gondii TaxID=5811 RepID=A0A086M9D3_TOXGO|nr:hypothetical protein TGRUB_262630 [Toxoplasma gondii RUB]KFH10401.1 hypothetical protein TGVAND_262630 [Toxoplasma gondii VAND]